MTTDKNIEQFFRDTKAAFEKSPIKKYAESRNLKWYYSISATRLTIDTPVIVGFNWGAADNYDYEPQTSVPPDSFKDLYDKKWLSSLQRIYEPLRTYLPYEDIDNCVQTNFCFFRSKEESEITQADLELSTPLFHRLIEIIKPKRIIGFSNKLRDHFIQNELCANIDTANIASNGKTVFVAKGTSKIGGREIPIYFLPHPNAKFTTEARESAWNYCFGNNEHNSPKNTGAMDAEKELFRGNPSQVLNLGIFLACIFLIPIPIAFWRWLQVKCTVLRLTNQRVMMTAGVFSKRTEEIELYRIRDVAVEEPFIYRLFGVGNIVIISTDKSSPSARLMAFKKPHWLKDQIRASAEHYRQNRKWGTIS